MFRTFSLSLAVFLLFLSSESLARPFFIKMPSPNYEIRPKGTVIDTVVIHDTQDNNTKRVLRLFCSRKFGRSPHFTIDKSGKIYQHFSTEYMGSHAGRSRAFGRDRVNYFSIGIELINKGDGKDPFTENQYRSLVYLLKSLVFRYHIKPDHILGHRHIALPRGRKSDPANNFSFKRVRKSVFS